MTERILDALEWHGPAQLEWIRDERDGQYRLLEINPRFWGTLELSTKAGLDFADLTVRMLDGETLDGEFPYAVGVRERWAFPEELLSVKRDRGRWRARVLEYVRPSDLFDPRCLFSTQLSDPAPELFRAVEFATWAALLWAHRPGR